MYYVRLLKPPTCRKTGSQCEISLVCSLTTDLGDDICYEDIELQIEVHDHGVRHDKLLAQQRVKWKGGMHALPATFLFKEVAKQAKCAIKISARYEPLCATHIKDERLILPFVFPVYAILDTPPNAIDADRTVFRSIDLAQHGSLNIWEDSGESIARHVWDAGVGLATLLGRELYLKKHLPNLARILHSSHSRDLNVLELGTGTGLAGLALTRCYKRCRTFLTDLPDARSLVIRNIGSNDLPKPSSASFQDLGWDSPIQPAILNWNYDLIIASDVTYNPDSAKSLVDSISRLAKDSKEVLIVVALKKRHASESAFFGLMSTNGFQPVEQVELLAPISSDLSDMAQMSPIHVYAFQNL